LLKSSPVLDALDAEEDTAKQACFGRRVDPVCPNLDSRASWSLLGFPYPLMRRSFSDAELSAACADCDSGDLHLAARKRTIAKGNCTCSGLSERQFEFKCLAIIAARTEPDLAAELEMNAAQQARDFQTDEYRARVANYLPSFYG
jgi:hypothetical protein